MSRGNPRSVIIEVEYENFAQNGVLTLIFLAGTTHVLARGSTHQQRIECTY